MKRTAKEAELNSESSAQPPAKKQNTRRTFRDVLRDAFDDPSMPRYVIPPLQAIVAEYWAPQPEQYFKGLAECIKRDIQFVHAQANRVYADNWRVAKGLRDQLLNLLDNDDDDVIISVRSYHPDAPRVWQMYRYMRLRVPDDVRQYVETMSSSH